jgi:type IV pilus assembly protein PilW
MMRRDSTYRTALLAQRGLTLIELMVAMTVGLFVALGVGLFTVTMSTQFRITGSNSAANVNTQVALSLVDDAGRSAGAGLYNNGKLLCPTINAWRDGTTVSDNAVLMPARIIDGGSASASDIVVFTAARANGALSSMPVLAPMASADASLVVSNGGVISNGDFALVGVPDQPAGTVVPCTLVQLTAAPVVDATGVACDGNAPVCQTLVRAGGTTGVNPNSPPAAFANPIRYGFTNAPGVSGPAVVNRLGNDFRQTAFSVTCNALVTYNAFSVTPSPCTSAVSFDSGVEALVSDVAQMHVQYGISNAASSDVVVAWVDASGSTWANPSTGDAARVRAVRVVLVTRAKEPDLDEVSTACTNNAGVVNTGPCGFDDAAAPVIDVSGLTVASGKTWRHYRYRTHQAVIPLRSVIWSS